MQMVEADDELVETRLRAGEIACVGCGGELRPWGYARWRTLRDQCPASASVIRSKEPPARIGRGGHPHAAPCSSRDARSQQSIRRLEFPALRPLRCR